MWGACGVAAALAVVGGVLAVDAMNASRRLSSERDPGVAPTREAFLLRAEAAMSDSDWGLAEVVLREAISIYDRDQDLRLRLADVLRTRANAAAWQRGDVTTDAVMSGGGDPERVRQSADAIRSREDSADAYGQLVAALDIGPRTADIEFRAGLLASEAQMPRKAIEHFQAARSAAPNHAEYAVYLAQAQLATNQASAAKASLVAAVNIDPDSAIAWGTLAEIFLRENKPDLAIENIRKARRIQPDLTLWRLVEARALKRRGDAEEAIQLLIALPAPEQRDGPVLSLLAECFAYLGRPRDAADRYGAASDVRPRDAALALEAARWYQRVDDIEKARTYADRASMLGNTDARTLAAELRGG